MPSCTVKSCKHNSRLNKKSQGITYHRFPEKNTECHSDWCKIIRESRGEDWVPTKSSVICSVHFEPEDVYITKNGMRRLANHAVPKILLSEASKVSVIQMAPGPVQNIPIAPQPVVLQHPLPPIITGGWATLSEQLSSFESTSPQNESVILPQTTTNVEVKTKRLSPYEPTDSSDSLSQPPLIIDEAPLGATYQPCDSTAEPLADEFIELPPDVATDWDSLNAESLQRSIGLAQNMPFEASYPESDDSLPPLMITEFIPQLPTPKDEALSQTPDAKIRFLEEEMKGKNNLLDSHVQRIKILNQKIRRLEKRNAALKQTLKTMKDKLFDDSELSNGLDQKVTGADLFNHFNKYRRQHNIIYTPAIKKFCLTLNSYSPKAYDYIRHTLELCIPHFRTLTKWQELEDHSEYTDESSHENFD